MACSSSWWERVNNSPLRSRVLIQSGAQTHHRLGRLPEPQLISSRYIISAVQLLSLQVCEQVCEWVLFS